MNNHEFDPFADMAEQAEIELAVDSTEPQREIWLASSISQEASLAYNEAVQLQLSGPVDLNALQSALNQLVARHQSLRATFSDDGLQFIVHCAKPLALVSTALSDSTQSSIAQAIASQNHNAVNTEFDLSHGPLFRASLLTLNPNDHVLTLSAHHIICDGWSFGVLVTELAALYSPNQSGKQLSHDAPTYSNYAAQELEYSRSPEFAADQHWWVKQYDQSAPVLDLPLDQPRTSIRSYESRRIDLQLPSALRDELNAYARREGITLFSVLLAGFTALMQRLSGQEDLVVGIPAAGQSATGMGALVGHCVNLLPVRLQVQSNCTIKQHIQQTQSQLLDSFDHQRYTFGTLLKSLQFKRDPSRSTLVSLMFNLDQELPESQFQFDSLKATLRSVPRAYENFEYFLNIVPVGPHLQLECQYNSKLFSESTMRHWLGSYQALLTDLVNPQTRDSNVVGQLAVLSSSQSGLLDEWSIRRDPDLQAQQLEPILRQHFEQFPQDLAVVAGRARLTYAQLQSRSAQLAHTMIARGVRPGMLVGVCMPRNADMIVAVYAVLMTGAAYVPLDPNFPAARLAYMVEDSKLVLVISDAARIQVLPQNVPHVLLDVDAAVIGACSSIRPSVNANDNDAAYVLYTSGSTGQPKGVAVPRYGLKNILLSMAKQTGLARQDRLLAVTTLSFDISLIEVFMPLVCGATVVVATRDQVVDGKALMDLIESEQITFLQATPSGWRVLFEAGWTGGKPGFKGLVGGESLSPELALKMTAACSAVWNGYGPTETSIYSTCWQVEGIRLSPPTQIAIGTPVANTSIHIRDHFGNRCPIGARGELCISGDGLAIGYLNQPGLTAQKFVTSAQGERFYRTGDLARWRSDGLLEHLGRMDTQVKLRGYRIELGEIEAALVKQDSVADAVAIVREDAKANQKLVAYVVAKAQYPIDEQLLREALKITLPRYMLPSSIVVLEAIPRLPNTKVDRNALPAPDITQDNQSNAPVSAQLATLLADEKIKLLAQELAKVMGKILGVVDMSLHQDFFATGGHSLTAAQFATRANRVMAETLPVSLSLRHVFEAPTPASLAVLLFAQQRKVDESNIPLLARTDRATAPLSLVQRRLWGLEQMNPGRSLYNTPSAHRLRGQIDLPALQRAFEAVVARQDVLRTVITVEKDGPVQTILDRVPFSILEPIDLSGFSNERKEPELQKQMQELIDKPLSMLSAPLFLAQVFRLSDEEHVLFFMTHHLIWDGWSFDLFYDEISTAYVNELDGKRTALPALAITYGDYCAWQVNWLNSAAYLKQVHYWREKLARNHEIKPLNTDFGRKATMSGRGATEWITLDREIANQLRVVARASDTTLFTVLLTAFSVLLRTLGSSQRQSIGIPVRGRNGPETEPVMGYFTNLLPLILNQEPNASFVALLQHAKAELVGAYAAPDVPMEELTSALSGVARSQPLYLALFSFQDVRNRPIDWGNLRHERIEVAQKGATEDFGLWFVENDVALVGGLTYNTDLYRKETARNLHQRLEDILLQVSRDPNQAIEKLISAYAIPSQNTAPVSQLTAKAAQEPKNPPQTITEKALAQLWSDMLHIEGIEQTDNFFDLGGNSLLAMQAVAAAEKQFGAPIDPRRYVMESLSQIAQGYDLAAAKNQSSNANPSEKKSLLGRLFGGARGSP
jgi:amino acid adenylation domain-containing protein